MFTGNEPADLVPMRVTVTNIRGATIREATNNTFDVTITYGSRIETYRGWVHAVDAAPAKRFIGKVPPRGEDALAALLRLEREHDLRPRNRG